MKNKHKEQTMRAVSLFFKKWLKFAIIFCSVAILIFSLTEYGYSQNNSQENQKCSALQNSEALNQELTELIIQKPNPVDNTKWISVAGDSITVPDGGSVTAQKPSLQNPSIFYACFGDKSALQEVDIRLNPEDTERIRLDFPGLYFPQNWLGKSGNLYLVAEPLTINTSANEVQYGKEIKLTLSDPLQQATWTVESNLGIFNTTNPSNEIIYTAPAEDKAAGKTAVTITASKDGKNLPPITIQLTKEAPPLTINASANEVQYGKDIKLTLSDFRQQATWKVEPDLGTFNTTNPNEIIYTAPLEDKAAGKTAVTITASKDGKDLLPITIQLTKEAPSLTTDPFTVFVSRNIYLSNGWTALITAILAMVISYLTIALAVFAYLDPPNQTEKRNPLGMIKKFIINKEKSLYLNPLVITSGTFGRASLSRLQLFGFTIVVIGLLIYLLMLTRNLSDLSGDILVLLGVSAAGTVGTGLVGVVNKRLSFENWAWVRNQGWLTVGEQGHTEKPTPKQHARWKDLILDENGTLNVYKFQLALASLLVAVFLIRSGGNNLGGFSMPQGFPELLGLSNLFYVLGRAVEPQSFTELNKTLDELRTLDKDLHTERTEKPGTAINKLTNYDPYIEKAQLAAVMLKTLFSDLEGTKFDQEKFPIDPKSLLPYWAENEVLDTGVQPTIRFDLKELEVQYGQSVKLSLSDPTQSATWEIDPPSDPSIGTIDPPDPSAEITYTAPSAAPADGTEEVMIAASQAGQVLTSVKIRFKS